MTGLPLKLTDEQRDMLRGDITGSADTAIELRDLGLLESAPEGDGRSWNRTSAGQLRTEAIRAMDELEKKKNREKIVEAIKILADDEKTWARRFVKTDIWMILRGYRLIKYDRNQKRNVISDRGLVTYWEAVDRGLLVDEPGEVPKMEERGRVQLLEPPRIDDAGALADALAGAVVLFSEKLVLVPREERAPIRKAIEQLSRYEAKLRKKVAVFREKVGR